MTGAIPFIVGAVLLLTLTLAGLLWPLLRRRSSPAQAAALHAARNVDILRDQRAELDRERADGSLSEADYLQAEEELKRRLLEEAANAEAVGTEAKAGPARRTAMILLFLIPALAGLGYSLLGNPKALDPRSHAQQPQITPQQIEAMVQRLADRLKDNPEDTQGWLMLARANKVLGRFDQASDAYSKAGSAVEKDPSLLADWAEIAVQAANGKFTGLPDKLIAKALKLNPTEPQALLLAGASAGQRGDHAASVRYWEKLLPLVEPGSEAEEAIKEAIANARLSAEGKGGKK